MIRHNIRCTVCTRTETHGSVAPEHPASCHTARMMRSTCREGLCCAFECVAEDWEPTDLDALRIGLRGDRAI